MISSFCLTTNSDTWGYPYLESIKSFLPVVDEMIVIDGGSTDDTVKNIRQLSDKIRVIDDEDVKWEDVWKYSRMSHNFDRGYQECKGDYVIKFDIDNILLERHEKILRRDIAEMDNTKCYSMNFNRRNICREGWYNLKKSKVLAINKRLCKQDRLDVHYGLDLENWGWGNEAITIDYKRGGIYYGKLLRFYKYYGSNVAIYNYDFIFRSEEACKELLYRFHRAISLQKGYKSFKSREKVYQMFLNTKAKNMKSVHNYKMELKDHPKIIQSKLKKLWTK